MNVLGWMCNFGGSYIFTLPWEGLSGWVPCTHGRGERGMSWQSEHLHPEAPYMTNFCLKLVHHFPSLDLKPRMLQS